jgi:hypothetical protein
MKIIIKKCDKLKEENDYNFKGIENVYSGVNEGAVEIFVTYYDKYVDFFVYTDDYDITYGSCTVIMLRKIYDKDKKQYIEEPTYSENEDHLFEKVVVVPENDFEKEILSTHYYCVTHLKSQTEFIFFHPNLANIKLDRSTKVIYE